jgi:hypothetical protein
MQEKKVEKLENTLEAALKRIEHLEQELKRPSVVEFDKTMDDKISELSSIIEEILKSIVTSQELTVGIRYMNYKDGMARKITTSQMCGAYKHAVCALSNSRIRLRNSLYKPGGTLTAVANPWHGHVIDKGNDSRLGN